MPENVRTVRVVLADQQLRQITWEDDEGEIRARDWLWSTIIFAKLSGRFGPYDRTEIELFL